MTCHPTSGVPLPTASLWTHNRAGVRRVSWVARVGDTVLTLMAVGVVTAVAWGYVQRSNCPKAAANASAAATSQPTPKKRTLETIGQDGRAVATYELAGDPKFLPGGVVTFDTCDGRHVFASGLWRVVESGGP